MIRQSHPRIEVVPISARDRYKQTVVHQRVALSTQASFVAEIIKVGSFHPSVRDGADEAGNATYRLMTPSELVARATEIAALAFEAFDRDDLLGRLPPFSELLETDQPAGFGAAMK